MDLGNSANWREEDLQALIANKVEESTILDYKQREALLKTDVKKDLSKDISAFANSAGGILVYGIIENHHVPIQIDDGLSPTETTKEWLEQVIQGNIRPRINGVHINPVRLDVIHPGKVAYVVTVPQGTTAHQASDLRYYKRFNFESVPMEDHEIRDVMNRLKYPLLRPNFAKSDRYQEGEIEKFTVMISMSNEGAMAAHFWKLVVCIPFPLGDKTPNWTCDLVQKESPVYGERWFKLSTKNQNHVIFPDDSWKLSEETSAMLCLKLEAKYDRNESEPFLFWKTYADNMPPQEGSLSLSGLEAE